MKVKNFYFLAVIIILPVISISSLIYSINKSREFTDFYRPLFIAMADLELAIQSLHLEFEELVIEGNDNIELRRNKINQYIQSIASSSALIKQKNQNKVDITGLPALDLNLLNEKLHHLNQLAVERLKDPLNYGRNTKLDSHHDILYSEILNEVNHLRALIFAESESEIEKVIKNLSIAILFISCAIILFSIFFIISRKSEQKAYQRLSESEVAHRRLFYNSYDGLSLIKKGVFIDCNKAVLNMLGASSKEQFLNTHPSEVSPEKQPDGKSSKEKADEMMALCLEHGHHQFDWVHKKFNGKCFWCAVVLTKLQLKNETVIHVSWRDITVEKNLNKDLTLAMEKANQANMDKSKFLANMSHELRTPMHGILSFANFGIKKWNTTSREKLYKYFENINISGQRLLLLLNNLLDLSKLEANKLTLDLQPADLVKVFEHCYDEQKQRIDDMQLTLQLSDLQQPVKGSFDSVRIAQVITNLLSNAINFSTKSKVIKVKISLVDDDKLFFSIQNQGIGIPSDELESIFDAFIQSSKTRSSSGGTGLGLAICKELIEVHKGKIWAENPADGGAMVSFIIPKYVEVIE